jgi:hypothetical protein
MKTSRGNPGRNPSNANLMRVWARGAGQQTKTSARAVHPAHTTKKGVVARPPKRLY